MSTLCPLCASAAATTHIEKNGFRLVRCTNCDLIYVSPQPSATALRAHYANPAYFAGEADQGYANYFAMHRALRPHFLRRLRQLEARHPGGGRLLDFGCADGFFLSLAQQRGWQVAGVELSPAMAQVAAQQLGVPVVTDLAALDGAPFDALTLWEVIEHLPDPLALLREFHRRLQPGGTLMLSTPNTGHWAAQRQPDQWISYRPPSHLIYFTAATLTRALAQAGFEQIRIRRVMPLPPLPGWLQRLTQPLQAKLAAGRPGAWPVALALWRVARGLAWAGQRLVRPADDVFATLEASAVRPT
jgi:2-polyprenyl-3-methyl-5-hydroxy-6-metoxy-1,4-benzoquinol methylase